MDYLDCFDRQELIKERARCSSELNQLIIKKEDDQSVKENVEKVKNDLKAIMSKCDERLKAQKEENAVFNGGSGGPGGGPVGGPDGGSGGPVMDATSFNGEVMIQSMQKTAKLQSILDNVRAINKLKTGDSVEKFISSLNQLYCIEVKPQLGSMPTLETEFVNCAKGLLTYPMFTQLQKSGKTINNWSDLEKYLISTHGSRISNFQYLHRLWNCQLQPDERFSDFGSRLEEQIHHASMHIQASFKAKHSGTDMTATDVFALMGAMLAALQIKSSHEDTYKSLIKTIDKNWSASTVLSDAADYADKMQSGELADPTVYHAKVAKKTEKKKKVEDKKPEKNKSFKKKSSDRLEDYKKKCANEICEAFLRNSCKYGPRCFRMHPAQKSSHYTEVVQPEVEPEVNEEDGIKNLFH